MRRPGFPLACGLLRHRGFAAPRGIVVAWSGEARRTIRLEPGVVRRGVWNCGAGIGADRLRRRHPASSAAEGDHGHEQRGLGRLRRRGRIERRDDERRPGPRQPVRVHGGGLRAELDLRRLLPSGERRRLRRSGDDLPEGPCVRGADRRARGLRRGGDVHQRYAGEAPGRNAYLDVLGCVCVSCATSCALSVSVACDAGKIPVEAGGDAGDAGTRRRAMVGMRATMSRMRARTRRTAAGERLAAGMIALSTRERASVDS